MNQPPLKDFVGMFTKLQPYQQKLLDAIEGVEKGRLVIDFDSVRRTNKSRAAREWADLQKRLKP